MENSMSTQTPMDKQAGDLERWASMIGGGALVLNGLRQRSLRGILTAIAGGGLVYQGTQGNSTVQQVSDAVGLDHAIRVEKKPSPLTNRLLNFTPFGAILRICPRL